MKFGKGAQLVLIIGVFAIASIFLYRMNLERQAEQEEINIQLSAVQLLLPKLTSEREELEGQLSRLQSNLAEAKSALSESKPRFPRLVESIKYDEILFQMARDRSLKVISLTASEPSAKTVEDVAYTVTAFNVTVAGEASDSPPATEDAFREYVSGVLIDILDFISGIATGDDFTTATVGSVTISVPTFAETETEESAEEEEEEAERVSAIIKIVIYSYTGE